MCLGYLCDILVSQLLVVTNNVFLVTDIVLWSPDHVNNIMWTLKILSYICHPICPMLVFPVQLKDKMIILLLNKILKILVLLITDRTLATSVRDRCYLLSVCHKICVCSCTEWLISDVWRGNWNNLCTVIMLLKICSAWNSP